MKNKFSNSSLKLLHNLIFTQNKNRKYEVDGFTITSNDFALKIKKKINEIESLKLRNRSLFMVLSNRKHQFFIDLCAVWLTNNIALPFGDLKISKNNNFIEKIQPNFILGKKIIVNSKKKINFKHNIDTVILTSGTSGLQKGVLTSLDKLIGNSNSFLQKVEIDQNKILGFSIPYYFTSAICFFFYAILKSLNLKITEKKIYPAMLLNQAKECNYFGGPPSQISMIISYLNMNKNNLKKLKLQALMSSGDFLNERFVKEFLEINKKIKLYKIYGLSEVSGRLCVCELNSIKKYNKNYYLSVGKVIRGMKIKIFDEMGKECNKNQIGEILVSGKFLFDKYFKTNDLDKSYKSKYFKTGDMGYISNQNYVHIIGRKDDVFKVDGIKVSTLVIQNFILSNFPNILDTCGITKLIDGSLKPIIFFVSKKQIDTMLIKLKIRDVLGSSHLPYKLINIENIPRLKSGKLNKEYLRINYLT